MTTPTSNDEAKSLLEQAFPKADITVNGDGYKYEAIIVSDDFDGLSTLQRHKKVYAALNDVITGGALHALSIKAKTPAEVE